ncbi:MAG: GNAT family N-acetyltransferase [Alphaproteobacteria bacterium]|nr:GNAT family N-acetyltransferase [Alphaproteobacteria bacterium]MBY0501886.1 GNAT family N-acetyltransferase [Alphaproteobacteria bacterium]
MQFLFALNPCSSYTPLLSRQLFRIGIVSKNGFSTFSKESQKYSLHTSSLGVKDFKVLPYEEAYIPLLKEKFCRSPWHKPSHLFDEYWQEQQKMERIVWLAFAEDATCGYVTLKWRSLYLPFQKKGIPEVVDLNVLPEFRSRGIGAALLDRAEEAARKKRSSYIGLGVGLYEDYGHAQKLYVKKGYVPDGKGVTYNYLGVRPGKQVPVDDDLILWFTKSL